LPIANLIFEGRIKVRHHALLPISFLKNVPMEHVFLRPYL
jgi:hypothetical protein